jgi:hypothetical protein
MIPALLLNFRQRPAFAGMAEAHSAICCEQVRLTIWSNLNGLKLGALLPRLGQSLMCPWEGAR